MALLDGTTRGGSFKMPFKNPEDKKEWSKTYNKNRSLRGYYRDWKRKNQVGKARVHNKREYTGHCEVCGRRFRGNKRGQFAYHHWDDEFLECGLYLCCTCHNMAEGIDKGLDNTYVRLKALVMLDKLGLTLEDRYNEIEE